MNTGGGVLHGRNDDEVIFAPPPAREAGRFAFSGSDKARLSPAAPVD